MRRRDFLKTGSGITACICAGGASLSSCKSLSGTSDTVTAPNGSYKRDANKIYIFISRVPSLSTPGGSVKISFEDETKIIVTRGLNNDFRAFSDKCTHGGRELEYDHTNKTLKCVSFGHSKFSIDGKVLEGPAEKTLDVYKIQLDGDILTIET